MSTLPKTFAHIKGTDGTYCAASVNNGALKDFEATIVGNYRLLEIKGSGIETWNLAKAPFPPREDGLFDRVLNGNRRAVAVLDNHHQLVAIALGRGSASWLDERAHFTTIMYPGRGKVELEEPMLLEKKGSFLSAPSDFFDQKKALALITTVHQNMPKSTSASTITLSDIAAPSVPDCSPKSFLIRPLR